MIFGGFDGDAGFPAAIGKLVRGGTGRLQIEDGDAFQQVAHKFALPVIAGQAHEAVGQHLRRHVGRAGEAVTAQQPGQHGVDPVLAQPILQEVEDDTALSIMDIALVLDLHERKFLDRLPTAATQIGVQLIFQEAPHLVRAIELLHHHQRRILGHGLHHEGGTLRARWHDLVTPILVADLVRGDVGDIIDLVGIGGIGKKANSLRIGNGAGKGLREFRIGREFDDAGVVELIRPKVLRVIGQAGLHRLNHARCVPAMIGMVEHGDRNPPAIGHRGLAPGLRIAGRLDRQERQDRRLRYEPRRAATTRHRVGHLVARCDRCLIGIGDHRDVGGDPGRIAKVIARGTPGIAQRRAAQFPGQATLAAGDTIGQQPKAVHPDQRRKFTIVDERAIFHHRAIVTTRPEAAVPAPRVEIQGEAGPGRQRRFKAQDTIGKFTIIAFHPCARHGDRNHLHIAVEHAHVQGLHRRSGIVDQPVSPGGVESPDRGLQIERHPHIGDPRLWQPFIAQIVALQIRLPDLARIKIAIAVEDVGVVPGPGAGRAGASDAQRRQRQRHAAQPRWQPLQPRHQRHIIAAPPQQMRQHRQHQHPE